MKDYVMFYLLGVWSGSCLTLAAIVLFRSDRKRKPEERFTFKPTGHIYLPEIPPPDGRNAEYGAPHEPRRDGADASGA